MNETSLWEHSTDDKHFPSPVRLWGKIPGKSGREENYCTDYLDYLATKRLCHVFPSRMIWLSWLAIHSYVPSVKWTLSESTWTQIYSEIVHSSLKLLLQHWDFDWVRVCTIGSTIAMCFSFNSFNSFLCLMTLTVLRNLTPLPNQHNDTIILHCVCSNPFQSLGIQRGGTNTETIHILALMSLSLYCCVSASWLISFHLDKWAPPLTPFMLTSSC